MQKTIASSLIEFSVENFGCFRDRVTFSLAGRKGAKNTFLLKNKEDALFKTSIIYGPNASGKSTLMEAMEFVDRKIRKSTNEEHHKELSFSPFLMEEERDENPISFEMIFLLGEKMYKYSFSLLSDHTVLTESLFEVGKTKDIPLFIREKQNIKVEEVFSKDKEIPLRTKEKALYLSTASQWNVKMADEILIFYTVGVNFFKGYESHFLTRFTAESSSEKDDFKEKVLSYLKKADFCISDFEIEEKEVPDELRKILQDQGLKTINFFHNKYDKNGNIIGKVGVNISRESEGTNTFFKELGPIIDTLNSGNILIVDELNSSLHPLLCKFIVDLFHSEKINPHNAQLIFTTHDPTLLSYSDEIDRDQFWFTERDKYGRASLFSLGEFGDRKNKKSWEKRYLFGIYGGVPIIDNALFKSNG